MALPRIPEPELMEEVAQAEAYAAADFAATDQAMVDRVLALFGAPADGARLADLGCGPGNITFPLARHCPRARVLGIDGSAAMLAIAERRSAPAPSGPVPPQALRSTPDQLTFLRLTLPCASATLGPWAGTCEAVVSNSLLHHIHEPMVLWSTVGQLAAPGAAIFVKDLRRPPSVPVLDALVALHAADAPPLLRRDYRHSLQAAFTVEEVEAQLQRAALSHLQLKAVEDRYLEVWGRLP